MRTPRPTVGTALLLAGLVASVPIRSVQAQSFGAPQAPPVSTTPWGGQLVSEVVPYQPHRSLAKPVPASSSVLDQAVPPGMTLLNQAEHSAGAGYQPAAMVDAVYLDGLTPPGPADIQVAGLTESALPPSVQMSSEVQPALPPGARAGIFQKAYFTGTWLPALSDEPDALGFGDLETGIVLGFPLFRRDTPLLITPQFGTHFLENAATFDVPSTLYDSAIEFRHLRKFGGGPWAMDVAATVGYYSDFDQGTSEAIRVSGRGLAVYESAPGVKWLFGVAYLNRAGASVLPVAGVIYEPQPDLRLDLLFPRPRVAWRTPGSVLDDAGWLYIGGEFGGGVWAVTRPSSGDLDTISYSDLRLMAGYERKREGGISPRVEFGYVLNRELDYESVTPDVAIDDTFFGRAGFAF